MLINESAKDNYVLSGFSFDPIKRGDFETDFVEVGNKMDIKDAFVSYIGNENYKYIFEIYFLLLDGLSFLEKKSIAKSIMERIENEYEFGFSEYKLDSEKNVMHIFDLIAFIEFRYVDFFAVVWKNLNLDILKVDIPRSCLKNLEQIIKIIDDNVSAQPFCKIVEDFLLLYPTKDLLQFFIEKSNQRKTEIKIRIFEQSMEERNYGQYNYNQKR